MSKGDKWRKTDYKNFYNNFDNISFKKKKTEITDKEVIKKKNKTTIKYN
jgi:hypothetical protein